MDQGITLKYDSILSEVDNLMGDLRTQACYIAEKCVNEAKSKEKENDWDDQTGNLRSSIGCVVTDGNETLQSFTPQQFKNGSSGVSEGKALLEKLQGERSNTLRIDLCAGMNYASFVENRSKKNVLMSARLKMETMFKRALEIVFGK